MQSYLPGGAIVHTCVIHGSLGLTSLHTTASASLSDSSAVLQHHSRCSLRHRLHALTVVPRLTQSGHIYFISPMVVICLFFVRCVCFSMLHMVSLWFIVLTELVKHILVAGIVRRNVKVDVKISNVGSSQTRVVFGWCCGGCHCDVDPRGK